MARPTKQGIDYFPVDCQFDDKTELYILEKESTGLSVLVTIWQLIYQNEGYYIGNNKDLHLLIKKRINVDINEVNDCINICLSRNIFDNKLHKKHEILTSKAIQKRFFDAAKRKQIVHYDVNYIINGVNVCDNAVNVVHQSANVKGEEKGDIKRKEKVQIPDFISPKLWSDFLEMRKTIKKPMTDKAKELAFAKLKRFKDKGHDVDEIISKSIFSSWSDLSEPNGNGTVAAQQAPRIKFNPEVPFDEI